MPSSNFRLVSLGRLALQTPTGQDEPSLTTRRRKLAVLAVIALTPQPVSRDTLVEMFWGEEAEERARHSLADTLSHIRRVLGRDAIAARREELCLHPDVSLAIDAWEVAEAAKASDWPRVLERYTGEFFAGVHPGGSAALEQWIGRERDRLRQCFLAAAARETRRHSTAGDFEAAEAVSVRWLAADPQSEEAGLSLLKSIAAAGTDQAERRAVAMAERYAARLRTEFGLPPAAAISGLAAELGGRIQARDHSARPTVVQPALPGSREVPVRRRWAWAAAAAALLVAGAAVTRAVIHPAGGGARPILAVVGVRNGGSDTRRAWIAEGLPQMIAAALSRSPAIDVVSPERMREVHARARSGPDTRLGELVDLGRRAGATWAVIGSFVTADSVLVLSLEVHEIGSRKLVRLFTVAAADPLRLADQAAARLLDAANAGQPGPRLADMETASLPAYEHYVRANQASEAGRFTESVAELDAALQQDSGFVSAITDRMGGARAAGDAATVAALERLFAANANRATEWDRLVMEEQAAMFAGHRERTEALARALLGRFPRDPRAYRRLAEVYINHGRWAAADTVLQQVLALDSLALTAGTGPCAPCEAYSGLTGVRSLNGQFPAAERAARTWVELQPELPGAWTNLAMVLSFTQQFPEAIEAADRAAQIGSRDHVYAERAATVRLMARQYGFADSTATAWIRAADLERRKAGIDLGFTLLRERGRYRASVRLVRTHLRPVDASGLGLVLANSLARSGDLPGAMRIYETVAHTDAPQEPTAGEQARGWSWHHALLASVVASGPDTVRLEALADSIERVGKRSYYGRDWGLYEYARGVLAHRGGRPREAVQRLERARWGRAGWTEVNVELARAYRSLGLPDSALRVLRDAYGGPLDAMGRYVPRSELDYEMAKAFLEANQPDSAAHYRDRLRTAWGTADPEPRSRLAKLDLALSRRFPEN